VSHGTLHRHLTQHKRLPEHEVRRLVRQLVGALSYLHRRAIAHRDIKLENVLLDERCNLRLIDFGFAILSRGKLRVPCGSPAYTAPEILLAHEYDGQLADVWSLGVLIFVMLAGRFPFQGATRAELSRNVLRGTFTSPSGLTREPESLLRRILVLDPHQRYAIENVRTHPWMAKRAGEDDIPTEHVAQSKVDRPAREQLLQMGLPAETVDASLANERHDHITTTYLLLARRRQLRQQARDEQAHASDTTPAAGAPPDAPPEAFPPPPPSAAMQALALGGGTAGALHALTGGAAGTAAAPAQVQPPQQRSSASCSHSKAGAAVAAKTPSADLQ
jgi:serine/threonine protein kinase